MKKFTSVIFIILALFSARSFAQPPCAGIPGANSITPASQTICAGGNAFFGLTNTYSNTGITFQWQNSGVSMVGPWTNIVGADEPVYSTPTLTTTMFYNVVITCTNGMGSISIPYSVTVIQCTTPCSGVPASNTILPANNTVCIGNPASMGLALSYTGTGMSYQWGAANSAAGPYTAIPGATLNAYASPTLAGNAYYNVTITCTNSSLSYSTTYSVVAVPCSSCSGTPAGNSVLPLSHSICAGSTTSMSLAGTYTQSGITYQWQSSGISVVGPFSPIPGATQPSYTTGILNQTTYYTVLITCTNTNQSIQVPHTVSVVACAAPCTGAPPSTSIVPSSGTICAGSSVSMSLSTTYTASGITYQWGSATTTAGPYTPITGATLSTYVSPSLGSNMFYNVVVTCTNSGMSYSTTAGVSVVTCTYCSGSPASNTVLPVSQTVCAGSGAVMNLAHTYTVSGITYQWQSSTVSAVGPFTIAGGASSNTYNTPPLNTTTYFNVIITCTNSGQFITVPHVVTVLQCTTPCSGTPGSNSIAPQSQTVCSGNSANMSLAYSYTTSGLTYQWGTAGTASGPYVAIPGATLTSYTSPPLLNNAYYNLVITCTNSGASHTLTHVVSVFPCNTCTGTPGANSIVPATQTICSGNPASLGLANVYQVSGITYQWQSSSMSSGPFSPVPGATLSAYATPGLTSNTYYDVVITCAGSNSIVTAPAAVLVTGCGTVGVGSYSDDPEIRISPNPNAGEFLIESPDEGPGELILVDVFGRIVFSEKLDPGSTIINITGLPAGIYYAQCITATRVRTLKVVKE